MIAGTIYAAVKLDQADRVYHGSDEPVTGNVQLTFRPSYNDKNECVPEFFGPLEIRISLRGRLKTKIHVSRGNSSSTYRGRVPIFNRTSLIFKDSAKIAARETWLVPFEAFFPPAFESRIDSHWESDRRFDCSQDQPLPPTFASSHHGFTRRYDSFIEYRVSLTVSAPHLPVSIITPDESQDPVLHYGEPRLPRPLQLKFYHEKSVARISNENLLPEEDRPSGFRQKAKAKLRDDPYPHYNFNWELTAPQEIHLGQPMAFEVVVKPREEECTAIIIPEINVKRLFAPLVGHTVVRAEKQFISSPEAGHDEQVQFLTAVPDDIRPFSKSGNWRKTFQTAALPDSVPSSFRTVNISQTYTMKLSLLFEVAGTTVAWKKELPMTVIPPVADGNGQVPSSSVPADSSGQAGEEEAPPQYEEEPPDYHEVAESGPVPPAKGI